MVNFSATDFKILLSMSLFVVFVSFLFPPLGFTSDNVNATEIPEFNASQNQFDHLNNDPELPSQPNAGTMEYIEGAQQGQDQRNVFLADEIIISTYNDGTVSDRQAVVTLGNASGDATTEVTIEPINESEYVYIDNYSYEVSFENLDWAADNESYTVDWEVHQRPNNDDSSWVDGIPIIGGLVGAGAELGGAILWIGQIIFQVSVNALISVTNIFITLFNVLTFIFNFFYWLLSTYGAVVAGSPNAWVGVFMAIPGIVLSFEFGKITILLIQTALNGVPFT